MTAYLVTAAEERLDRIAKAILGAEGDGATEALLDANPGLAAGGPAAPFGTRIVAPDRLPAAAAAGLTRPWE